jgi:hypothetical protein
VQFACLVKTPIERAIFVVFTSIHPTIVAESWTASDQQNRYVSILPYASCKGDAIETVLGGQVNG